jgi:hypothetical protein
MASRLIILLVALQTTGLLVGCASSLKEGSEVTCPITPIDTRDPDADVLVGQLDPAQEAAFNKRQDAGLTSVFIGPAVGGPTIYFAAQKDKEVVSVGFSDDKPVVRTTGVKPPKSPPLLVSLSDLNLGPARAMEIVLQQYPGVKLLALGLSRSDCELVCAVSAFDEANRQGNTIFLSNTGQILRIDISDLQRR